MLKKLFFLTAAMLSCCTAKGYEICGVKGLKVDGDLSDWKNIAVQRIAGERYFLSISRKNGSQNI